MIDISQEELLAAKDSLCEKNGGPPFEGTPLSALTSKVATMSVVINMVRGSFLLAQVPVEEIVAMGMVFAFEAGRTQMFNELVKGAVSDSPKHTSHPTAGSISQADGYGREV